MIIVLKFLRRFFVTFQRITCTHKARIHRQDSAKAEKWPCSLQSSNPREGSRLFAAVWW